MECLTPRNGVPCGTCPRCRLNRQRDWTFRLSIERDASDFVFWLTLTFDDVHLVQVMSSEKAAREPSRHFLESIRKKFPELSVKHYLVTEYGDGTDRWHHHCLLFVKSPGMTLQEKLSDEKKLHEFIGCNDWDRSKNTCWPFGGVQRQPLHSGVFPYVTNYVNKPELLNKEHKIRPFTRISRGIGLDYLSRVDTRRLKFGDPIVWFQGTKKVLPRYYREKLLPRSTYHLNRAIIAQDWDKVAEIESNRMQYNEVDAWQIATKKHNEYMRAKNDFERTHTIVYEESLQHQAANEFRRYKEKLAKRQNL